MFKDDINKDIFIENILPTLKDTIKNHNDLLEVIDNLDSDYLLTICSVFSFVGFSLISEVDNKKELKIAKNHNRVMVTLFITFLYDILLKSQIEVVTNDW